MLELMPHTMNVIILVLLLCNVEKKLNALDSITIESCDDQTKNGSLIIVNYQTINLQCTCIIKTHFNGILQLTSTRNSSVNFSECSSEVTIKNDNKVLKLPCTEKRRSSETINVSINSTLVMIPEYARSSSGGIYQEIRIFEEKNHKGSVSVTCGNLSSMSSSTTIAADVHVDPSSNDTPSKAVTDDTTIQNDNMKTDANVKKFSTDTNSRALTNEVNTQNDYINTDVNVKISSIDTTSKAVTDDTNIQNDNINPDLMTTPIIYGIIGAAVVIIIGIICIIVIWRLRRTQSVPDNRFGLEKNGAYEAGLPDNPLYHSYQPMENSDNNTSKEQEEGPQSSTKKDNEVTESDENPIYAKPNKIKE